jgi:hypothetical protein
LADSLGLLARHGTRSVELLCEPTRVVQREAVDLQGSYRRESYVGEEPLWCDKAEASEDGYAWCDHGKCGRYGINLLFEDGRNFSARKPGADGSAGSRCRLNGR